MNWKDETAVPSLRAERAARKRWLKTRCAHLNPRVGIWLWANNLEPEVIARKSGEDLPRLVINGSKIPWPIHYSQWIIRKWMAWAKTLGAENHVAALRDGLGSDADFDAWLLKNGDRE